MARISSSNRFVPQIDRDCCMLCGGCAAVCPNGAVTVYRLYVDINLNLCKGCGSCVKICPVGAIEPQTTAVTKSYK